MTKSDMAEAAETEIRQCTPAELAAIARAATEAPTPLHRIRRMMWSGLSPLLAFAIGLMPHIDLVVSRLMERAVTPNMHYFWQAVTDLGDGTVYIAAAALAFLVIPKGKRLAAYRATRRNLEKLWRFCALMLAAMASSAIVLHLVKFAASRHRPSDFFRDGVAGFFPFTVAERLDSFPSGHSQTIFVFMATLMIAFPRHWKLFLAVGAFTAISRVVLLNHFPSDILIGSWLGAFFVLLLAPLILRKGDSPLYPRPEKPVGG
ncbi:membrane-associated phospholipid phosphatase [Parvibaculum indicum]|uniref:phosphatase PAP2 family protein n=1 Tax=Parvibaculum indicum TaxID=562969 RepID=UPI0014239BE8|nr:phosphatase PAP2 family protein [Parvibaculum indicum]NIJ40558.1 membrane-associated phospholipid phosphatase [Parvibaculum indicum]